jgi:hypothetical protein
MLFGGVKSLVSHTKEKHRNKLVRKMLGQKIKDDLPGDCRKLHNEKLQCLTKSTNKIKCLYQGDCIWREYRQQIIPEDGQGTPETCRVAKIKRKPTKSDTQLVTYIYTVIQGRVK